MVDPAEHTQLDALVVSGGNDIGHELYGGQEMPKAAIDRPRDQLEIRLIERALREGLPILGICRGAQLLSVVLGGSLIQDVRNLRRKTSNRATVLPLKRVRIATDSLIADIFGKSRLRVNSLHHQAIDKTGAGVHVVARDRDALCQAVECSGRQPAPVLGVQWHPEYLLYVPAQLRLFRWLKDRAQGSMASPG